jgi:type IV pilus assembly protein PilW
MTALMHRQRGLSLVEILVAMMIGLIGVMIISQVYITADNFNRSTIGEGGAQTNGVIALYQVERDVRMGGYGIASSFALGCGQVSWYHAPDYTPNAITIAPVLITVDASAAVPDMVTVMYSGDAERAVPASVISFTTSPAGVTVDGTIGYDLNDMVLLVKRATAGGCSMARVSSAPSATELSFGSGTNNPANWGSFPTGYTTNDKAFNLGTPTVRRYSVATATKKLQSQNLFAAAGTAAEAMVDGIVDLRAQYGKDTVGNDGVVDVWNSTAPANTAEWQQVLAVRIGVLARIGTYERPTAGTDCDATTTAPNWAGGNFGAVNIATTTSEDRCYRYRVFETTIPLRNMIWRPS